MCVYMWFQRQSFIFPNLVLTCCSKAINSQREVLCNFIWNLMTGAPWQELWREFLNSKALIETKAHYLNL